jgi:TatD DNase family protein
MPELVDIGCNLAHDSFDCDRARVVAEAAAVGVRQIMVTGTSVTASVKALELCAAMPGTLFATAGIHPHHASEHDAHGIAELRKLLADTAVVAVGECGLDYHRNYAPRDAQLAAFEAQLELAADAKRPVFLHERDAHEDSLRLLRRHRPRLVGGVAHCFTAGRDELEAYLDLDLHIGITGWICDERRGGPLRAAVAGLPLERLLLETDAPYLLPRDLEPRPKHRRNEPKFLPHIAAAVAAIMERPIDEVADAATLNARRLFALV